MNTQAVKLSIIIVSYIFLISSLVFADSKGRGKDKTNPPGWEQGEKKGWEGKDTPPGLSEEKLEKKQKVEMKEDSEKGKAKNKSEKVKHEAEIEGQKKKKEAEIKKEKKKRKPTSKKKKG